MSKFCILGDTHFGARGNSKVFHDHFETFYSKFLIPFLVENNISTIFQLGDLWDNRKAAQLYSVDRVKSYFFNALSEKGIKLYTLIGNHDIFYRESLSINSSSILLKGYDNVTILDSPTTIEGIDIIPWICKENEQECLNYISNSRSLICMGHFEIQNFSMYKGVECKDGLDPEMFSKYEYVFSGHYHHKSNKGNIHYVGTPYELTWQDFEDPRGFHIFDTQTRKLQFFENPYKTYHKLRYDESIDFSELTKYTNCYLKISVKRRTEDFQVFLDHLDQVNPAGYTIIEDVDDLSSDDDVIDETQDTVTIMNKYIDGIKNKEIDIDELKELMSGLYQEAIRLESE